MPPTPGACGLLWMAAPPPTDKLAEMAWSLLSNWQKKSLSVLPQEFAERMRLAGVNLKPIFSPVRPSGNKKNKNESFHFLSEVVI